MIATETPSHTAMESALDFLLGKWRNLGVGETNIGETNYSWDMDGKWFMYDSRLNPPGMGAYRVCGGVAWNSQKGKYDSFAYNNQGNLLIYDGQWENENRLVFILVHPVVEARSRVVYIKNDNDTVELRSERAAAGEAFSAYFVTTLSRL